MIVSRGSAWFLSVLGNAVVGACAGVGWPFVYLGGYAIAAQAGWIVADPTVVDDGTGFLIVLGAVALLVLAGMFAGVNVPLRGRGRLPVALAVTGVVATLVSAAVFP
ncbi:hypothetical protein [Actinoplanes ianthinogenes]|uniref:hypothetical protein n=1 Tax=Actinoplanes ianthinogenes TaxID=122358 RepID=UPI0016705CE0|nr:hypothetical protein [Actinoplanes ianthinogenes]